MIKIIYGSKGTGKTKRIIDAANSSISKELGDIVFITDTSRYIREIKYQIRFTNTKECKIASEDGLLGFIQGMLEANYDIRLFFIDGAALFGRRNRDCCTVDGCHPDDLGFSRMAEKVYGVLSRLI